MLTQPPSLTGMFSLVTRGSYQGSHCCCLNHEAGVLGSYSHLLGETGCQWLLPWSKVLHSQPPAPAPSPTLSAQIPSQPLP